MRNKIIKSVLSFVIVAAMALSTVASLTACRAVDSEIDESENNSVFDGDNGGQQAPSADDEDNSDDESNGNNGNSSGGNANADPDDPNAPDDSDDADEEILTDTVHKINPMTLVKDYDPFTGSAAVNNTSASFTLDNSFNSVVCDLGEAKTVNRITLKSLGTITHVNKTLYSVYYSNDNKNYTYVKDFSLLREGKQLYFYNLNIKARYIKIHSTANGAYDATGALVNIPKDMIVAEYSTQPLRSRGEFSGSTSFKVKNDKAYTVYDKIEKLTLDTIGIDKALVKDSYADVRFICDGKELPYYVSNGLFYVRVLEVKANSTATVEVLYGNKYAYSVSDGEEALEITYGTKYSKNDNEAGWDNSVATMPNGDLLRVVDVANTAGTGRELAMYRSTNGGLSWTAMQRIPNTSMIGQGGAFIVDYKNSTVFFFAFNPQRNPYKCPMYVMQSKDNGHTWSTPKTLSNAPTYALTYSDGIVLSTADGSGPAVDYVLTCAVMTNTTTASFSTSSIYSKDGGKTWIHSSSYIKLADAEGEGFEGGLSEESVIELKDGTLMVHARCQIDGYDHFAISYSKDKGITWSVVGANNFSNFYTPNTQPITEFLNGVPIMMWGGNNNLGALSYMRYPLNLAPSYDDAKTFTDFVDVSFATIIATAVKAKGAGRLLHTNPDLTFVKYRGIDSVYIVSTRHQMYVINVEDFLYKTKGAFDSFENGTVSDGWLVASGSVASTSAGVTDGSKAMKINPNTVVMRSLHYITAGNISFSLNTPSFGSGFRIELQSAYNDVAGKAPAPITLAVTSDGSLKYVTSSGTAKDTGVDLNVGQNEISIIFNGESNSAIIMVNGRAVSVDYVGNDGYISYVTVFTNASVAPIIDNFIAIKDF